MKYTELDTPALLIERKILADNIAFMQKRAQDCGVALRPHTKTHKMPRLAQMQMEAGACGIAVAKTGEAEVMVQNGLRDIFIANEIVGRTKLARIMALSKTARVSFGVDSICQVEEAERVFQEGNAMAEVLIEIEVGENRSGVIEEADFLVLLDRLKTCRHVKFKGIFSHDGNSYGAATVKECLKISAGAQKRTLHFAELARQVDMPCTTVSYGSTPTLMNGADVMAGITEIRPGTYALMDASQAHAIGTTRRCAATVLASVISRPTKERVILDVGAKGLTMQERRVGICATPGKGTLQEYPDVFISAVFDEHAIIYDRNFRDKIRIGDKVRVIPVHICPVCNLYERAYFIAGEDVIDEIPVLCRGKLS